MYYIDCKRGIEKLHFTNKYKVNDITEHMLNIQNQKYATERRIYKDIALVYWEAHESRK